MSNVAFSCKVDFYSIKGILPPKVDPSHYSKEILLLNDKRETLGLGYYRYDSNKFYTIGAFELGEDQVAYWGEIPMPEIYIVIFSEDGRPAEFVHSGTGRYGIPVAYSTVGAAEAKALELDGKGKNIPGTRTVRGMTNGEYHALVESLRP